MHRKRIGSFFLQYKTTHTLLVSLTAGKDRQYAAVASVVEQPTCNRQGVGSNPTCSSNDIFVMAYYLILLSAGRSNRGGFAMQKKKFKIFKLFQLSADFVGGFVMRRRKAGEWHDRKTEKILR